MLNPSQFHDIKTRLTRIESKLVRGFEELGLNIDKDHDWLSVDDAANIVYISTLGRSLMVTLVDMQRMGATKVGQHYDVVHRGDIVGTLVYAPLNP